VSDDEDSSRDSDEEDAVQTAREAVMQPVISDTSPSLPDASKLDNTIKVDFSLDGPQVPAIVEDEEINFAELQHKLMH
jgi:hypothetical protein